MGALLLLSLLLPSPAPEARISLDFKDAPIGDVLRLFAEVASFQFVLDPGVQCSLTLRLKEVPVGLALETTLKACRLGREEENGVLRIAPAERLIEEAQLERRLEQEKEQRRARKLTLVPLSYARAEELAPLLQRILGSRAEVIFDHRTNTLLIKN